MEANGARGWLVGWNDYLIIYRLSLGMKQLSFDLWANKSKLLGCVHKQEGQAAE